VKVILTHNNADFDAVAAQLAAHKLYPDAVPVLPDKLNRNVESFLHLYANALPFVRQRDFDSQTESSIEQLIVVDTQRPFSLKGVQDETPTLIIDHHPITETFGAHVTVTGEVIGATATLMTEELRRQNITLNSLEATLLALGLYEDTGSLTYEGTTPRDILAAAWLLEQHADLDAVRRFLEQPLNDAQRTLFDALLKNAESRVIQGYTITVSAVESDSYVYEVSSVVHRLNDTLDPAAIFVVVKMPNRDKGDHLLLVGRSSDEAIDAGEIAQVFGGGGHTYAAASSIDEDKAPQEIVTALWDELSRRVQPMTRVGNLMSYSARTVSADEIIKEVAPRLRRIGHEGYPVVDGQPPRVVGLLTRRDADRAIEHGLGNLTVREVMSSGDLTLRREDSVQMLEQHMVESGWGQIPVVDDTGKLIGIVTRTDLIKHWARTHPAQPKATKADVLHLETVLGADTANLIDTIAKQAQAANVNLYMVGGVVRDLLLNRRNLDIDFVVESADIDAIAFAHSLKDLFGGEVSEFRPFGTAKWELITSTLYSAALPEHIDFATARNEFYEHPTALPTVYDSSIKLDLGRRDFTINTLAVQLSPASAHGSIIDFYGGLNDLKNKHIRVLHSLSFVDDPTRILRAVRFEQRLGFSIEPRTAELIETALPMLGRITGERLRNELWLLLHESEPERGLVKLQTHGALAAIHPTFIVNDEIAAHFAAARQQRPKWAQTLDLADVYWNIIAASLSAENVSALCERLVLGKHLSDSLTETARLAHNPLVSTPDSRPSQIVAQLDGVTETALFAVWIVSDEITRSNIERYRQTWRSVRPISTGHTLQELGLTPGPAYARILARLRAGWLDGELSSAEEEQALVRQLVESAKNEGR